LRDLRLAEVDFERYRNDAPELADEFNQASGGLALAPARLATVMAEQAEAGSRDEEPFVQRLAAVLQVEAGNAGFADGLAALCARLVELDPTLLGEPRPMDVHLREALRLAADWWAWQEKGATR
jgi:hypothetical protein